MGRPCLSLLRRSMIFLGALTAFAPSVAHAEASSWLFFGGGEGHVDVHQTSVNSAVLRLDAGVGTKPSWPIMVGIGARFIPYFEKGVDWAVYARVATRSYVTGWWGVAVDGGGYARKWGGESTGELVTLNIGMPWGVVVSGNFDKGTEGHQTMSALVGIDFLRLTVYRTANTDTWPNPFPAWRPDSENAPKPLRREPEAKITVEGCSLQAESAAVVQSPSSSSSSSGPGRPLPMTF